MNDAVKLCLTGALCKAITVSFWQPGAARCVDTEAMSCCCPLVCKIFQSRDAVSRQQSVFKERIKSY